jgi:NADPH:quinone reductase-like Zn-dependent oxidoreductase
MDGIPRSMRAAWYERTGPADQVLTVGEAPTPVPRANEVLVRVAASGVNPHDTKRRSGWTGEALPGGRHIPHSDGAGTIVAVGPGVPERRIGERVWLSGAGRGERDGEGSCAEYCALPAERAFPLPDGVAMETGATLGVPAMTAHRAVFCDGPVTGQTVLVTGAAGAVATYAAQFCLWDGAEVIGTVSSEAKAAQARRLGIRHVLDTRREDVAARVLEITGGRGVERIVEVDFGANIAACAAALAPSGVIAAYSSSRERTPVLDYYAFARKGARLHFVQGMILTRSMREEAARDILAALRQQRLIHPPPHAFPLDRVAEAHLWLERGGGIGKSLVLP